jgi:hypothetical protein
MRGNIVVAAAIAAVGFIVASVIFTVGISRALNSSGERIADAVDRHATQVQFAGNRVGEPISKAIDQMNQTHAKHGDAIITTGKTLSRPTVTWQSPLPIVDERPLRVQGTVGIEMGENKEAKKKLFEK